MTCDERGTTGGRWRGVKKRPGKRRGHGAARKLAREAARGLHRQIQAAAEREIQRGIRFAQGHEGVRRHGPHPERQRGDVQGRSHLGAGTNHVGGNVGHLVGAGLGRLPGKLARGGAGRHAWRQPCDRPLVGVVGTDRGGHRVKQFAHHAVSAVCGEERGRGDRGNSIDDIDDDGAAHLGLSPQRAPDHGPRGGHRCRRLGHQAGIGIGLSQGDLLERQLGGLRAGDELGCRGVIIQQHGRAGAFLPVISQA